MVAEHDGIFLDYSRQCATAKTMKLLMKLARSADLEMKLASMASGAKINSTEARAVLHVALRAAKSQSILVDGKDVVPEVHKVLERIASFSNTVREGKWTGASGKALTSVVAIGIGGSYLGPEFVYEALRTNERAAKCAKGRTLRFLANVDPVDVSRALHGLDPESTLVIVISKSFTTAETMLNARTLRSWLLKHYNGKVKEADVVSKHVIALSANVRAKMDSKKIFRITRKLHRDTNANRYHWPSNSVSTQITSSDFGIGSEDDTQCVPQWV